MAYRAVVRHVRYWRGQVHRWSTVYPFIGTPTSAINSTDCQTVLTLDDHMCAAPEVVHGAGTYECAIYDQATGGVPIATYIAFDYTSPSTWINHSGTAWGTTTTFDGVAETALSVTYSAGLSKSGKPVYLRKWYHAVPTFNETTAGGVQITSGQITSLTAGATALIGALGAKGLTMGSASGRFAGTAHVSAFLENHQMPRGRRRKALVTASGRYTGPSVVIGPSLPQTDGE